MRSSTRLITVLIAALLFVTPLTIASAQSGTEGYDAYYNLGNGLYNDSPNLPQALPVTGGIFYDGSTDFPVAPTLGLPEALPVTGGIFYDGSTDFPVAPALPLPEVLPVTGAAMDDALEIVRAELAASGILLDAVGEPVFLPQTGVDVSALPDIAVHELIASGIAVAPAAEPGALPVTGDSADIYGFTFDGSTYRPDLVSPDLPDLLPLTGSSADVDGFFFDGSTYVADPAAPELPGILPLAGSIADVDGFFFDGSTYVANVTTAGGISVAEAPPALPVTGDGVEPLALTITGFIWPDDVPYASGDTHVYNDSGVLASTNAPDALPQTGSDRLGVVGGR